MDTGGRMPPLVVRVMLELRALTGQTCSCCRSTASYERWLSPRWEQHDTLTTTPQALLTSVRQASAAPTILGGSSEGRHCDAQG